MKKTFRRVISLILIIAAVLALSLSVSAATTPSGNLSKGGVAYKLSDDKSYYVVVGYDAIMTTLTIESSIDGIPVTEIAESAFHNNANLNSITIPSSVTKIGARAFRNCSNLTSVALPSTLTFLPEECFYDCNMLSSITLPSTLEAIDDECFKNCTMLGKLKIPASVTTIGHDVFLNCESILLDVSENAYAAEYAKRENVNTEFENSSAYFFLIIGASIAVGIIAFILLSIPAKKYFEKHPKHNPALYIGKFFFAIGKGIAFIFELVKKLLLFVLDLLISLLEILAKKRREYQRRRIEKKEQESGNSAEVQEDIKND